MSKKLKQTFSIDNVQEKKHSIRFDKEKDAQGEPLSSIYINKEALKSAGVKLNKIKSVDVILEVHDGSGKA